jgi:hypothetical protein
MAPAHSTKVIPVNLVLATILTALLGSSGCRAIEGIFKAGVWTGILGFVLLIAVVFGLVRLLATRSAH